MPAVLLALLLAVVPTALSAAEPDWSIMHWPASATAAVTPTAAPTFDVRSAFIGVTLTTISHLMVRWEPSNPQALPVRVTGVCACQRLLVEVTTEPDRPARRHRDYVEVGFFAQPIRPAREGEAAWAIKVVKGKSKP